MLSISLGIKYLLVNVISVIKLSGCCPGIGRTHKHDTRDAFPDEAVTLMRFRVILFALVGRLSSEVIRALASDDDASDYFKKARWNMCIFK